MPEFRENPSDNQNGETSEQIREKLGLPANASQEEVIRAEEEQKKFDDEAEQRIGKLAADSADKLREDKLRDKVESRINDIALQNKTIEYVEDLIENHSDASEDIMMVMQALAGIDTEAGWKLSNHIIRDHKFINSKAIASRLSGLISKGAQEGRRALYYGSPQEAIKSLVGIVDARNPFDTKSEDLRQSFRKENSISKEDREYCLLVSYGGVDTPESWELRNKTMERLEVNFDEYLAQGLAKSLIGLYSGRSEGMQKKLLHKAKKIRPGVILSKDYSVKPSEELLTEIAESLVGDDSPEARAMRKELRHGEYGERLYLISITGIDSQEADNERNAAFQKVLGNNVDNDIYRPFISSTETASRKKEILIERKAMVDAILDSLRGVNSVRADGLRTSLRDNKVSRARIAQSMYGGPVMVAARARFKAEI